MMRTELLNYLLEASICQAAFYLFYRLALRDDTFFKRNRYYLLATSCLSLIIPQIKISNYQEVHLPDIYFNGIATIPQSVHYVQEQFEEHITTTDFIYYAYLFGLVSCLAIFISRLFRILYIIWKSKTQYYATHTQIDTAGKLPTFSFLHYLFWNNSQPLQPAEAEQILGHELTHIREKHSLDILYIEVLQAAFWFNPFIYLYKSALQDQHEFRADFVVAQHHNKKNYTKLMVATLYNQFKDIHLTHNFSQSSIKKRIVMINKRQSRKAGLLKMIFVLPVGALLLLACTPEIQPESLLSREQIISDTTKVPSPSIVLFSVPEGENFKVIDLRKGISVKDFPNAIHARAIPDPEYSKTHPGDARFRVATFKVLLVKGRRPTLKSVEEGTSDHSDRISLKNILKEAQPGDRLYIEIIDVQQLNAQYQVVNVKVDEKYKRFNLPITE